MNMNTIVQELNKKLKKMSKEDFEKFVSEMIRVYEKQHYHGIRKKFTFYSEEG